MALGYALVAHRYEADGRPISGSALSQVGSFARQSDYE
jgi:hypothetical protein